MESIDENLNDGGTLPIATMVENPSPLQCGSGIGYGVGGDGDGSGNLYFTEEEYNACIANISL